MQRLQLWEIEDQTWCPGGVRDAMTDYLHFVLDRMRPYRAVAPRLRAALDGAHYGRIVDLCSGGGGPWPGLLQDLAGSDGVAPEVCLTDRFPNLEAFRRVEKASMGRVTSEREPVDATAVPQQLEGFRTLFSSFHHFPPDLARSILEDAVQKRQGIAVFEATQRTPPVMLGMLLVPLLVLLVTPAIRPFRWSRLFWTYLLPVVPLAAFWDGFVSCLRTYTPEELREMVASLPAEGYQWQIGEEKVPGSAAAVTYLIGYPAAP